MMIAAGERKRIKGPYTGTEYRFDLQKVLYVDRKDALFLLGKDYDIL